MVRSKMIRFNSLLSSGDKCSINNLNSFEILNEDLNDAQKGLRSINCINVEAIATVRCFLLEGGNVIDN
jgi:hypothetical protein